MRALCATNVHDELPNTEENKGEKEEKNVTYSVQTLCVVR